MKLLIGADPEILLMQKKKVEVADYKAMGAVDSPFPKKMVNVEEFVSAYGIIPGTKKEPFKVQNGAVQVDGMALEFNIDPVEDADHFVYNIKTVMEQLRGMVPEKYQFSDKVTAVFDNETFSKQPLEATQLGCDPDFNAYTQAQNGMLAAAQLGTTRMVGGHIHLGWTENQDVTDINHFEPCCQLARQLDYFLAVPSIILDDDLVRKKWYGKAGAFRPKPYGMEYRTLSNFWLKSEEYQRFVFKQAKKAFDLLVDQDKDLYALGKTIAREAYTYKSDKAYMYKEAKKVIDRYGILDAEDERLFKKGFQLASRVNHW